MAEYASRAYCAVIALLGCVDYTRVLVTWLPASHGAERARTRQKKPKEQNRTEDETERRVRRQTRTPSRSILVGSVLSVTGFASIVRRRPARRRQDGSADMF